MQRIRSLSETGRQVTLSQGRFRSVSEFFLVDKRQDLRGRLFKNDDAGRSATTVKDMLVDPDLDRVALIELSDGRRIPIEKIRLRGRYVTCQT